MPVCVYRHRVRDTYYIHANLTFNNQRITLSGFPEDLEQAKIQAQALLDQLEAGTTTIEQLRKRRKFQGRTVIEWAQYFGVSRNAIYKAARNKSISVEDEILRRLPAGTEKQLLDASHP